MAKKKLIGRHDKVMDLTYGKKYNPKMKLNAAAAGDWLNVFSAAPYAIQGYVNNSDIKEREDLERRAQLGMSETFNGVNSLDALQAARNAYAPMPSLTRKDLVPTTRERIGNVFTATLGGFGAGLGTGNIGLAAGLGLLSGTVAGLGIPGGNTKADNYLTRYRNDVNAAEERLQKAYNYQLGNIYDNSYNRLMANYSAAGGQLGRDGYPSRYSSASMPDVFTHGGIFSNGMELIDAGGSHEENPNGGVVVSYDPEGVPNIVEEGEVIFNDYVFSNRFGPTKDLLEKYKLPKEYEKYTFARLAEMMGRESKERPNDAISKRGLESSMDTLQSMQEEYKEIERQKEIAKLIKRMTPEEKAAMFDAAAAQEQQMYGNPEEMYAMQEPQMEMPAFMPQEYAMGGNIFDGKTESRIRRGLNRRNRRALAASAVEERNELASREQQEIINSYLGTWNNSSDNKLLAEEFVEKMLTENGVPHNKRDVRRIAKRMAGYTEQQGVRADQLYSAPDTWDLGAIQELTGVSLNNMPSVQSLSQDSYAVPGGKGGGVRGGVDEDARREAEERDRKTAGVAETISGRSGYGSGYLGGRNPVPSAGSATKAAETAADPLQKIVDDTALQGARDVENYLAGYYGRMSKNPEFFSDLPRMTDSQFKTITDKAKAANRAVPNETKGLISKKEWEEARAKERRPQESEGLPTWMRYAGAAADALGAVSSLLTPPDYTHARQIRNAGRPYSEVTFTPVENPLTFRPIDRNYVTNEMRNSSLGLARQLVNASGANPGVAVAGLAGLNYGTNQNIGQGYVQGDLGNFQMESQVKNFNRAGQQYNSEGMFKESVYNRDRFQPLTQPEILAAQLEAQEDAFTAQARSENISNFANALAEIGQENAVANMISKDPSLYYQMSFDPYRFGSMYYAPRVVACGGKIKTKKRK